MIKNVLDIEYCAIAFWPFFYAVTFDPCNRFSINTFGAK
jgi:hypothetical protein